MEQDPYDLPIEELNPAHPDLFAARKTARIFTRLREEDPVHFHEGNQFGPYWSITKYEDIQFVDRNHEIFSSDILNGGMSLGGRPIEGEPNPMTHLPMFIM